MANLLPCGGACAISKVAHLQHLGAVLQQFVPVKLFFVVRQRGTVLPCERRVVSNPGKGVRQ